jgi:2'-5' RNA ligase
MSRNKYSKRPRVERVSMPMQQAGSNMMVIPDSMMQAIYMQQSPQKSTVGESMLPGAPLEPYKGIMPKSGPRSWNFPVGWNIGRLSRSPNDQEVPTFQQLRTLARSFDGIQMCERVWMDLIGKVQMTIKPRPDLVSVGDDEGNSKYQKDITKYMKLFEKPDRQHYLHEWLRMAITDQLEIDALAIYMHPARDGSLYAMEIVDGTTIKPLLDDRGRRPDPPYPAYQQYLYGGLPGAWLDSQQMLYVRESPRSDSPYGISRVERIITRVNQALRKQQKDLARYTDGNIPAGILELPPGDTEWTSDQVAAYQQMFDALLAGNDAYRSRIKVMPPGTAYTATDEKEIAAEFDKFLLNIAVADFGLSMADLSFTEDVNKSSGDSQENMTIRRTMLPLLNTYGTIFTQVLKDYFNDDRFIVGWTGFEEPTDLEMKANAYKTMISAYMISPSDAAREMHQPVSCEIPIFYPTANGPIFFEDLLDPKRRQAQNDASMAGFQMAVQNPGGQKQIGEGGDEENNSSDSQKPKGTVQKDQNQDDPAKKSDTAGSKQSDSANKDTSKSDDASEKQAKRSVEPAPLVRSDDATPVQTGIMVAFMLDPDIAAQMAVPGGEPANDLHVTLAYMGNIDDEPASGKLQPAQTLETLKSVLLTFACSVDPLQGGIGGIARFSASASSDCMSPIIALINAPGLQEWRRRLVDVLDATGYAVAQNFDYTPHCTLIYIDEDEPTPSYELPDVLFTFDTLCLSIGDDRYFFPIGPTPPQIIESETRNETTLEKEPSSPSTKPARGDINLESKDSQPGDSGSEKQPESRTAIHAELKRWRTCALHDIKSGKRVRAFESDLLPVAARTSISSQLEGCVAAEEARFIFKRAGDTIEEYLDFLARASLGGASRTESSQNSQPSGDHPAKSKLLWSSVSHR